MSWTNDNYVAQDWEIYDSSGSLMIDMMGYRAIVCENPTTDTICLARQYTSSSSNIGPWMASVFPNIGILHIIIPIWVYVSE